jgi:hypothetical protein
MDKQLILNIHRSLFWAEAEAYDNLRLLFDIDTRENLLEAYIESCVGME